ncbi:MAG: 2-phospho-L-lactate transferase [Gammaproteobacteria bacterium]|nr:2-phospho-L-lactate transferase [Gammaproteobacteria bacterium]
MIVALAGGVGGAKLAFGLQAVCSPDELLVVVNTGDDFEHLGLTICPDLDTVNYTLSGRSNRETGWGLSGESWNCLSALETLGAETWFRLGDRDLATHLERTRRLREGQSLSDVTHWLSTQLGVRARVIPMSDDPVRTIVNTPDGALAFQDYFVRRQCEPTVLDFEFRGASAATPHPHLLEALASDRLNATVICPSNPYLSIAPMLAIPGIRDALIASKAPVVAVSPIVGGQAIKGPAAKIMQELKVDPSPAGIAAHYGTLLNGLVVDDLDAETIAASDWPADLARLSTDTIMRDDADRTRLATQVIDFARGL